VSTRVVVADDHPIFRSGLRSALGAAHDLDLVGEAESGEEVVALVASLHPDVVVMDLRMGEMSGAEATRRIQAAHPEVAVLVLTMSDDDDSLLGAIRSGAAGYVLKGGGEDDLITAVRAVARGEALFGAGVSQRLLDHVRGAGHAPARAFPELTPREEQLLDLVAQGLGNPAIAARLHITPKTVRNQVSQILTKISAHDRADAIRRARHAGLGGRPFPDPSSSHTRS